MEIGAKVLQEETEFDQVGSVMGRFRLNLLDGDWSLKYSATCKAKAAFGAICGTTWVEVDGGRIYFAIGRKGMEPRFFPGNCFPEGTEFLVTPEDNPGDGAGGSDVDEVEGDNPPDEPAR